MLSKFQAINHLVSKFLLPHASKRIKGLICLCTNYTRQAVKASGSGEQKHSLEHNISKDFLLRAPIHAPTTRKTNHHRTTLTRSLWTWGKAREQPPSLRFIIFNEPAEVGEVLQRSVIYPAALFLDHTTSINSICFVALVPLSVLCSWFSTAKF